MTPSSSRRPPAIAAAFSLAQICAALAAGTGNLVENPSFDILGPDGAAPQAWSAAGMASIRQHLSTEMTPDGGRCARLHCSEFSGSGPAAHAMICQTGRVGIEAGRWYRVALRARGNGIRGVVEVGLSDTRTWESSGLSDSFTPDDEWRRFEFVFQAERTIPPAASRLQVWFRGTGTLWIDDVEFAETETGLEWFPHTRLTPGANPIANASFECGESGWGSLSFNLRHWGGNLYRLAGAIEETAAAHGRRCLRIDLDRAVPMISWFDYFEPRRDPVTSLLAANLGWIRVTPGEPVTLSASVRAATPGTPVVMALIEAPQRSHRRVIRVGRDWERLTFTVRPSQPFVHVAIGPDLAADGRSNATVWIDAVRLDPASNAAPFAPAAEVESRLVAAADGGLFTNPAAGLAFQIDAYNAAASPTFLHGRLVLTDFFDREADARDIRLDLPAEASTRRIVSGVLPGRPGFFLAHWIAGGVTQTVRCANIEPIPDGTDTFFGFNHAYPWEFLVRRAQTAGAGWWRDWSAKWHTVEPASGRVDYAESDAQIRRVTDLGGRVLVLLPFPSAPWSSAADERAIEEAAGGNAYLRDRMRLACAARNPADFDRYAARTAARYAGPGGPSDHVQLLNEPVFTTYALPRKFGYGLDDYLRLLDSAGRAIRAAAPGCRIVGGISCNLDSPLAREFVEQGGLRHIDIVDLHNYDAPRPAAAHDEAFREFEALVRAQGGPKPIWITEWGCYADDDPPTRPWHAGDATMNRCRWPSERAAAEHIAAYAAVAAARGVRKIFFHAGTCGAVNGPDAGGVLFEYGGAPRRMLPAVAAFQRLVGVPDACAAIIDRGGVHGRVFRMPAGAAAVVWRDRGGADTPIPTAGLRAFDIMGAPLPPGPDGRVAIGVSPVYLVAPADGPIIAALSGVGTGR